MSPYGSPYAEEYAYSDEEDQYEYERQRYAAYITAMRERDEVLVQSAQEKMAKAKTRGKRNVQPNQEEVDALERHRQLQEQSAARPVPKGRSSRSNSAVSLNVDKSRAKKGNRFFSSPNPSRARAAPKSPRTTSRKASLDASSASAPGFVVQGPNGQPIVAPFGYFPPGDSRRPSTSSSRSASANSKRQITPPYDVPYPPYQPRYYPYPMDPRSNPGSPRQSPDSLYVPRNRSATTAGAPPPYPPEAYGPPSMPAAQGRRNVSDPRDISYSKLRRMPPGSPLAEKPLPPRSEAIPERRADPDARPESSGSGSTEDSPSGGGSSEDEEQGVRVNVDIVPDSKGDGYRIDRKPVAGSGGERRRRHTKR